MEIPARDMASSDGVESIALESYLYAHITLLEIEALKSMKETYTYHFLSNNYHILMLNKYALANLIRFCEKYIVEIPSAVQQSCLCLLDS